MLDFDRGRIITLVGMETSEDNQYFQSEGSVITTKASGAHAYVKYVVPNPRLVSSMFRSSDKYTVDVHSSVDEFLAADNPMLKLPAVMEDLTKLSGGHVVDALGMHLMTDVSGAMYRAAEAFAVRDLSGDGKNAPNTWSARRYPGRCAIYYNMPGVNIPNPLEGIIKMRLIGELCDRLFERGSQYLPLLGDMMQDFTGSVAFSLVHTPLDELLTKPELQLLVGINGIVSGARRMPQAKQLYMSGSTGTFFTSGPAHTRAERELMFGPEMADYVAEILAMINGTCNYQSRSVDNAVSGNQVFSTQDILARLAGNLWTEGTPALWFSDMATSIRLFREAQKAIGKIRVRQGARTREYREMTLHLDALEALLTSIPEVQHMNWAYSTERYHIKTQFGGWSFTPEMYRVYYTIVNPLRELQQLIDPGASLADYLIEGTSIMSYEPLALTTRSASSDWFFDVPADHLAVEVPVIIWLGGGMSEEWLELKEWCRSQTSRVVRPTVHTPFGLSGITGIFPLNPAVMEGTVMATALRNDRQIVVDKERTLAKVDGNICLPGSTIRERSATGQLLYQLPDRTIIAEHDPSYLGEVPAGWKY